MLRWFGKYFGFSRRELNGIIVLLVLMLLLWFFPYFHRWFISTNEKSDLAYVADIEQFLATAQQDRRSGPQLSTPTETPLFPDAEYFVFDPNGLAVVDWKRLGLSDRQIQMIKNYEAKGGRFHEKEDLRKIYAINDGDYARLEPYIEVRQRTPMRETAPPASEDIQERRSTYTSRRVEVEKLAIDLNEADSIALQQLHGIGPAFSSRIVRFRDMIGGFHHVSQLLDVYGFDSVRYEGLKDQVYVNVDAVRKIALNSADYQLFRAHPFINAKQANAIVQYRKQHGPYQSLDDLLKIVIIDEVFLRKIAPYLTLDD